jgi:hypothetical protein
MTLTPRIGCGESHQCYDEYYHEYYDEYGSFYGRRDSQLIIASARHGSGEKRPRFHHPAKPCDVNSADFLDCSGTYEKIYILVPAQSWKQSQSPTIFGSTLARW